MCISDWPRYRSVGLAYRVGRNVFFFTKVASVPELGPRHDASAETCFSCRFARFFEPSVPECGPRHKRLFFTKLRYKRLFLHNFASVPEHGFGRGLRHAAVFVFALVFGVGTCPIEAALRSLVLSFAFLRSPPSVPRLELRHITSAHDPAASLGS